MAKRTQITSLEQRVGSVAVVCIVLLYSLVHMENVVKVNADVCVIALIKHIIHAVVEEVTNKCERKAFVNLVENVCFSLLLRKNFLSTSPIVKLFQCVYVLFFFFLLLFLLLLLCCVLCICFLAV